MRFREGLAMGLMSLVAAPLYAEDAKTDDAAKPRSVELITSKDEKADTAAKKKGDCKENCPKPENCKEPTSGSRPEATHKQSRVLTPKHDDAKISLNTYCLTPAGELLICVGGTSIEYVPKADDPGQHDVKRIESAAFVQKYSSDGELLAEFPVEFKPTAINMVPGGAEFVVAGEGWLVRMTLGGETVKKNRTPNVGDQEKFKEQALEAAKAELKEYVGQFEEQLKQAEVTLANLEETPEADQTNTIKAQIEAQKTLAKEFKEQIAQFEQMFGADDPDSAVRDRLTVTGVAVTENDVFVSVRKLKGHGYDIWRTNHDFAAGEKVVEDLGGCCGQLDIQASGDKLLIAENGKFRVGVYDRDGEITKSFGKRDRKASDGFGSCCNPMNVRCCANGEVLTAESSIGDIKRFTTDGKFVGYVGRAKIGGGCKHVAVEYDATRNRYFMQHQDKGHICVLVPKSEITGPSEDELLEKAAREGLGAKLVGSWNVPGSKKAKTGGLFGLLNSALGSGNQSSQVPADRLMFDEDGGLIVTGGQMQQYASGSQLEWKALRQIENQLDVGIVLDGVETFNFKVTFNSDDALKIDFRYDESVMATGTYQRESANAATTAK